MFGIKNCLLVVYTDVGPLGPGGQDSNTNKPHSQIHVFDDFSHYDKERAKVGRKGRQPRVFFFEIDSHGNSPGFKLEDHRS